MREKVDKVMELSDPGAEKAVLAGIYQHGIEAFVDVSEIISLNSFTILENKCLFKVFETILKECNSIDETSIITTIKRLGYEKEVIIGQNNIEHLKAIFTFPIALENIEAHAKRVAKLEFARNARYKIKRAYDDLANIDGSETIDQIVGIPENIIFEIVEELHQVNNNKPELIGTDGKEILLTRENNPGFIGIQTPFKEYNRAIGGGFRRGGVNLIAARVKVGKSIIAREIGWFVAQQHIPVLLLDTEMLREDQFFRLISSISKVDIKDIEDGTFCLSTQSKNSVYEAQQITEKYPLFFNSVAGKPFEDILSTIRRWILKDVGKDDDGRTKDCLVIYDYFKLMDSSILKTAQEYQAIGFQMSRLSDFAKHYDFACLAFTQLNREEDISQSDRLRWFAHSYARFRKKTKDEMAQEGHVNGNRRMHIEDARFGPGLGEDTIDMKLIGNFTRVEEIGLADDRQKRAAKEKIEKETGFNISKVDPAYNLGVNDD